MSLIDRLSRRPTSPPRPDEAQATQLLNANRGRPPIQNTPTAGRHAAKIVRPLLASQGVGLGDLRRRWAEIAGEGVAKAAWPEKLTAGVLTLKAPSAAAPFVQHQIPLILERCRLAGASLKAIKIEQGAKPVARQRASVRPLTAEEEKAIAAPLLRVEDEGLRAALMRLGRAVASRN